MSGIAGIYNSGKTNEVKGMLNKISHRGSIAPNLLESPEVCFGAIGLSVLNEESGPFTISQKEMGIIFDGKLTDHNILRKFLSHTNINGASDPQWILHAFKELDTEIFNFLEGEFALALIDGDRLILARDRLGIRPLYYGFHGGSLCFASEIKALIDYVEEVREFPPGNYMISDSGLFPYSPYFPEELEWSSAQESARGLAEILTAAVKESIPDHIETGVWLSGGVDSSIIAALARPNVDRLYTFSAGMEGAPDLGFAQKVADHIQSVHHIRVYSQDEIQSVLEKVIYMLESFDAPLVRSAVANYLVSQLAGDYVPFVLSGEGGDELFAGYDYQKDCGSEVELTLSVQDAIASLHNTALQRVDRSAAAHGTRAAVPYLHPEVVRYALAVPARWKIKEPRGIEKWPLRKGLSDSLPDSVIWREKSKFWQGAGAADAMIDIAEDKISDREFQSERLIGSDIILKSKEEMLYYRIFNGCFGSKIPAHEVGRTLHI